MVRVEGGSSSQNSNLTMYTPLRGLHKGANAKPEKKQNFKNFNSGSLTSILNLFQFLVKRLRKKV
jgi:hypothetical protein